ncbi:hypothetical protein HJC23_007110 [Cyclotella cryptica]|uniref:Complex 1 LYR protein domain-containing protein n=1 Tax=Cyclotella cryptica TaxID=29204 RepID=A0ABD3P534_9STRA|eukprot:CCRYP_018368-RA/>CCRYP_018368-RA protein AED:0.02 eAED:-0.00 QI:0/-1/0/1/-1/1/1/0/183
MISSKQSVLRLYRRCLKSVQQIPDLNQRATYLNYVKDGFRRKAHLPQNSREAILAYRDGTEQVTDMEYYQQMAKLKHKIRDSKLELNSYETSAGKEASQASERGQDKIPSQTADSEVYRWLTSHLPHLRREDATRYCDCLVEDGFDSVSFIEEELVEDDLDFMKRAHRRVIIRHLENQRNDTR